MEGQAYIPGGELFGMGYVVTTEGVPKEVVPTHKNLNDAMTPEQQASFRAYMRGENITFTTDGTPYVEDQRTSVQSVEEAIRLQQERETGLGA